MNTANRAAHQKVSDDSLRTERERFRQWKLDMEETTIPYHKILTWPSQDHWNRHHGAAQGRRRHQRAGRRLARDGRDEETRSAPPASASTSRSAPFSKVIEFIIGAKQLNIFVDPAVGGGARGLAHHAEPPGGLGRDGAEDDHQAPEQPDVRRQRPGHPDHEGRQRRGAPRSRIIQVHRESATSRSRSRTSSRRT